MHASVGNPRRRVQQAPGDLRPRTSPRVAGAVCGRLADRANAHGTSSTTRPARRNIGPLSKMTKAELERAVGR